MSPLHPGQVDHQSTPSALTPSLVRTLLPFLAGLLGTWVAEKLGVPIDGELATALATVIIGYLYYVIARFLEVFASDKWGYVLGFRKLPVYADPPLPTTVVAEPAEYDPKHRRDEAGAVSTLALGVVLLLIGVVVWVATTADFVGAVLAVLGGILLCVAMLNRPVG